VHVLNTIFKLIVIHSHFAVVNGLQGHDETSISENGIGVENEESRIADGQVNNDYRISFMRQQLVAAHQQKN
jgi:beta-glucosidase/6-phospho-beta-glucosidase/beta-galactosidase